MLNLSACCRELRAVSEAARRAGVAAQRGHTAVRACEHDDSRSARSTDLLWYGQGLTVRTWPRWAVPEHQLLAHLEQLNLSVNRFAEGAIALFDALGRGSLPRLTVLDLTGNAMGRWRRRPRRRLERRAAEARDPTPGRNAIGDAGLVALALPLGAVGAEGGHPYGNQIGDAGVEALLSNLGRQQLKRLETLNLERNQIDDAGHYAIAALGGTAWPYRPPRRRRSRPSKLRTARCEADEGRCRCRKWGSEQARSPISIEFLGLAPRRNPKGTVR